MRLRACRRESRGISAELGEELSGLKYPLYFMDFETVNPAIPRFPGHATLTINCRFSGRVHVQRQPGAEV